MLSFVMDFSMMVANIVDSEGKHHLHLRKQMLSLKHDNKLNILFIKRYFITYRGTSDIAGAAYEVR